MYKRQPLNTEAKKKKPIHFPVKQLGTLAEDANGEPVELHCTCLLYTSTPILGRFPEKEPYKAVWCKN